MKKKAIIISIKGFKLTKKEKKLISEEKPWGLILFKRNIKDLSQVKTLIKDVRKISKDKKFPIMIDEEGPDVSRLKKIISNKLSQSFFGINFTRNPETTKIIYRDYINYITSILNEIGININTVPVLDVLRKKTHKIIGNRSYSKDPKIVKLLGELCIKQYKLKKIGTVIKHIPGHGCSNKDSHKSLPKVTLNLKTLICKYP